MRAPAPAAARNSQDVAFIALPSFNLLLPATPAGADALTHMPKLGHIPRDVCYILPAVCNNSSSRSKGAIVET
jgi:hypothetical protein